MNTYEETKYHNLLSSVRNLENEIRYFLYENSQTFISNECQHELCNLLTIKPIHYQLEQESLDSEIDLFYRLLEHLYKIEEGIELLRRQTRDKDLFQGVWYMIYQAYVEFELVFECNILSELGDLLFKDFMAPKVM
jgi:hypothetical protein